MVELLRKGPVGGLVLIALAFVASSCQSFQKDDGPPVVLPSYPDRLEVVQHEDGTKTLRLRDATHKYARQESEVWCWAACASMIHRMAGKEVSQQEVVERVQGVEGLEPKQQRGASFFEVVRALTPAIGDRTFADVFAGRVDEFVDDFFSRGAVVTDVDTSSGPLVTGYLKEHVARERMPAIDDLKLGHGALVGLRNPDSDVGHVYVMFGATFREPSEALVGLLDEAARVKKAKKSIGGQLASPFVKDKLAPIEASIEKARGWFAAYERAASSPEAKMALEQLGFDRYDTQAILLLDPEEENAEAAEVSLSAPEFLERVDFVLSASDAQAIAEKWLRSIEVEKTSLVPGEQG